MPITKRPDPLSSGHIDGQNPSTPERLPGHTADVDSVSIGGDNENELGGRPAFLFEAGEMAGVTLDSSGANLPELAQGVRWQLARYFTLGVRSPGLQGVNPEPIIRGIRAQGFYVWRKTDPSRMEGTTQ